MARVEPRATAAELTPSSLPWKPGTVAFDGWTVPAILRERARREPNVVALREKWLGRYQDYTWSEVHRQACDFARGLIELGLEQGDRVAIMGDPCREYIFAEYGISIAGGVSVGIYPTSAPGEVLYHMRDSEASIFIAEDQEHLDKLLANVDQLPSLKAIILIASRTLYLYDPALVTSFESVQLRGAERAAEGPSADALVDRLHPDDAMCLVYTSGTTGGPKGVLHSHRTVLYGSNSLVGPGLRERDQRLVAHLPLAHVLGKYLTITLPLLTRIVPHIPERIDVFQETVYEVAPTYTTLPPRFFEKYAAQILVSIDTSSRVKRAVYRLAAAMGRAAVRRRWRTRRLPPHLALGYLLARGLVFIPLLRQIGYHKLRLAYTGSAAVPPEVVTLWQVWGVDLRIMYGSTESGGIITMHQHPFPDPRDVGTLLPLPGWELKVAEDGELLFRCPSLFVEYWNKPDVTASVLVDGWLHTGDVCEVTEQGSVRLIDRKSDIVITSGGKSLSPQQIENEFRASPYISEAVVFAEGRKYVAALLELDHLTVSEWARERKIAYGSYGDLVRHDAVRKLVEREVANANDRLSRVEQVKRFAILPMELDPEMGSVTPTRKVKRKVMENMFRDLIETLYEADDAVASIRAEVEAVLAKDEQLS
jgi:long-chain acyl-CoA synthetase